MFPEGNVPGYVCNPGSPRERDAASQGHTSGIATRALLHSWKLAPAAHHVLLSILVMTSPAPDVWLSILTDYTYDSELDIADGVPLVFRRSVSFPRGTRFTYVTWDVLEQWMPTLETGRARGVRVRGGGWGGRGWGRGRGRPRTVISDEIRATLVDHVVNHGLTMREAGQRVQPHLSRYTVASIIRTFRNENR